MKTIRYTNPIRSLRPRSALACCQFDGEMPFLDRAANNHGITMRGRPWRIQKIDHVLSNRVYMGEFYFNRIECRTSKLKPLTEWVKVDVPAIIDEHTFDHVAARRHARQPSKIPEQQVSSPALLVGLMKCGHCDSGMTQATGKSGRYRYYKCTTRMNKGVNQCNGLNLGREATEQVVLTTLAEKVFTPSRVEIMLRELITRKRAGRTAEDARFQQLTQELKEIDTGIARLYEAVEKGLRPLDTTLQERAQKLQARRQDVLVASAALRDKWEVQSESAVTFPRNPRSRSIGIRGHLGPEYAKSRSTDSRRYTSRNSRVR